MTLRSFSYWFFSFLLLVAALVLWRYDILVQRPYGGSAMGVFVEASHVAFADVATGQSAAPSAYQNSLATYLLAGILRAANPGTPTILAYRLFTFACAALATLLMVGGLHKRLGWGGASITAAAIHTTPIFTVQVEQLGVEIPMTAFVVLAVAFLLRERSVVAGFLGLLAFALKWTGAIYLLAGSLYLTLRGFRFGWTRARVLGLATHLVGLSAAVGLIYLRSDMTLEWGGWVPGEEFGTSPLTEAWRWSPDLLILAALAFVLILGLAKPIPVESDEPDDRSTARPITFWDPPILFSFLFTSAMIGLLSVTGAVPANLAVLVPFIIVPLGWVLLSDARWRLASMFLFFLLVGLNLVNSTGMFFPALAVEGSPDWRTGALRERSREYLADDHALNVDVVRALLKTCRDKRIAAPPPFAQFLSLPALGYVVEPFAGYSLGGPTTAGFQSIEKIQEDAPKDLAVVAVLNRYTQGREWVVPPLEQGDSLVYPISKDQRESPRYRRSPLLAYVPRQVPSEDSSATRQRYLRRFWPTTQLLTRARQFIEIGRLRDAEIVLRQLLDTNPTHHEARLQLGLLLELSGRPDLALTQYEVIPSGSPMYWQSELQSGAIYAAKDEFDQADRHFAESLAERQRLAKENPQGLAGLYVLWSVVDTKQQRWPQALEKLEKAVQAEPNNVFAHRDLGYVLLRMGRLEESRQRLETAVALNSKDPLSHVYLGAALVGLEKWEEARSAFTQTLRLAPDYIEAQDGLGTVLVKLKRFEEAIQEYEDALARDPESKRRAELFRGLSYAQRARGSYESAVNALRRAAEADPSSLEVANQLAWMLAAAPLPEHRNAPEAVQFAERAAAGPDPPSVYLDTLATAYAEAGEWEKAVSAADRAVDKARAEGKGDLVAQFTGRAELFRRKEAYHEPAPTPEPADEDKSKAEAGPTS